MTTTLITGANKGLGYETARQLVAAGHTVWAAARSAKRGEPAASSLGARFVELDVTSDESITAALKTIEEAGDGLDVLVNNAGIARGARPPGELSVEVLRELYETNVFGAVRVTEACLPLLQKSSTPVIVNVSSGLGSLGLLDEEGGLVAGFPGADYPSSKAALNMLTRRYARTFPAMRINAADPGFTATDLNQHRGTQSVEEGAEVIVALARAGADGPTGGFFNRAGAVPW